MAFFNNEICSMDIPVFEGAKYDVDCGALATIITECNQDQLDVIKAIHAADIAELRVKAKYRGLREASGDFDDLDDEEEDELKEVEEASLGEFWNKVKSGLSKLWGKIKAFFKSLYEKLFVFSKSNKNFADSFTTKLQNLNSDPSVTIKGYPYMNSDEIIKFIDNVVEKAEDRLNKYTTRFSAAKFEERYYTNGESAKSTDDAEWADFKSKNAFIEDIGLNADSDANLTAELFAHIRGTAEGATDITYKKNELIKHLEAVAAFDPKKYKKSESKLTKGYDKVIKDISKAEKTFSKLSADGDKANAKSQVIAAVRQYSSTVTMMKTTSLTAVNVSRTAIVDYANQIKQACVKLVGVAKESEKAAKKKSK